jgi:hypothetical protein
MRCIQGAGGVQNKRYPFIRLRVRGRCSSLTPYLVIRDPYSNKLHVLVCMRSLPCACTVSIRGFCTLTKGRLRLKIFPRKSKENRQVSISTWLLQDQLDDFRDAVRGNATPLYLRPILLLDFVFLTIFRGRDGNAAHFAPQSFHVRSLQLQRYGSPDAHA